MSVNKANSSYVVWGNAILRRLEALKGAGAVIDAWTKKFQAIHTTFSSRNDEVTAAFSTRHNVMQGVVDAERAVEAAFDALTNALPAAGIGDRRNPLRGLSDYSPTEVHELGHQHLATEAVSIAKNVRAQAKKLAPKKAELLTEPLETLVSAAAALTKAIAATGPADDGYHAAVQHRDGALVEWNTTLGKLRRRVDVHFEDTPDEATLVFAPPAAAEADVHVDTSPKARAAAKAATRGKKAAKDAARAAAKATEAQLAADKKAAKAAKSAAKAAAKQARQGAKATLKATKATKGRKKKS